MTNSCSKTHFLKIHNGKKQENRIAGTEISVISQEQDDYISLTDMAKKSNAGSYYHKVVELKRVQLSI